MDLYLSKDMPEYHYRQTDIIDVFYMQTTAIYGVQSVYLPSIHHSSLLLSLVIISLPHHGTVVAPSLLRFHLHFFPPSVQLSISNPPFLRSRPSFGLFF